MKHLLQYFLLLFLIPKICFTIIPAVHSLCTKDQQLSLLHLKKSLQFSHDSDSDSHPTKVISWNSSTDCCSWLGVNCSSDGHVVGLDLSSEAINDGIDDSSSLFDLQHLQSLNLADNHFTYGTRIPSAIGKLVNLRYLNLSSCSFYGSIPKSIANLTQLVGLHLGLNMFSGSIDSISWENLINLVDLQMDDNLLEGSIPSSLFYLPLLTRLVLSRNQFSGKLQAFSNPSSHLAYLDLSENQIQGKIPHWIWSFNHLDYLNLSCNSLVTLEAPLYDSGVSIVDLHSNQLQGQIPTFIPFGYYLDYSSNHFNSIPSDIGFTPTAFFSLSNNNLHGVIPASICNTEIGGNPKLEVIGRQIIRKCKGLPLAAKSLGGLLSSESNVEEWENILKNDIWQLSDKDSNILPALWLSYHYLPRHLKRCFAYCSIFPKDYVFTKSNLVFLWMAEGLLQSKNKKTMEEVGEDYFDDLLSRSFFQHSQGEFDHQPVFTMHDLINDLAKFVCGDFCVRLEDNDSLDIQCKTRHFSYMKTYGDGFEKFEALYEAKNLRTFLPLSLRCPFVAQFHMSDKILHDLIPTLQCLRVLNLSGYNIRNLPNSISNLKHLKHLDLSYTLIGKLPDTTCTLYNLQTLLLSYCRGLVELPTNLERLINLRHLDIRGTKLEKMPPKMGKLQDLQTLTDRLGRFPAASRRRALRCARRHAFENTGLDLSNNFLSGIIPPCLTAMRNLRVLNLARNNLTGTISNFQVTEYCLLEILELGGNQLGGQFPKSLGKCTQLQVLNLGNNRITDTFPCLLKNMSTLRVLVLRSNNFYGGIGCPNTYGTWPVLQIIHLAHNNFTGEIPGIFLTTWQVMMAPEDGPLSVVKFQMVTVIAGAPMLIDYSFKDRITVTSKGLEMDLVRILSIFTLIDLSCNNFSGPIPKEMGEFKSLRVLNLSGNSLTGEIPSSFGNMQVLESLDLSQNKLGGQIPRQLTKLTFLSFLNISYNQLVGRIPTSTQFSTFPKDSFTGNKGLWGPPLTVDNIAGLSPPPTLNGSLPNSGHRGINWDLISVEIGFTVGFGVSVGSLVLCKRWSKWYYRAMYRIVLKIFPQLEERIGIHRRHVHINRRWRH
ncbi:unnamed protein product [Prunus brigantina]